MKRFVVVGIDQADHDISDSTTLETGENIQEVVEDLGLEGKFSADGRSWIKEEYRGDVTVQEVDPERLKKVFEEKVSCLDWNEDSTLEYTYKFLQNILEEDPEV
jgi:hypothetical protein